MTTDLILHIILVLASLTGFIVSYHIRHKKSLARPFVCPLKFDCHTVVTSDYSRVLGIPLEIIGMLYYTVIGFTYMFFILFPQPPSALFTQAILFVTAFAFFFSIYLTIVQARMKHWCSFCLVSAVMCTIIFSAVIGIALVG